LQPFPQDLENSCAPVTSPKILSVLLAYVASRLFTRVPAMSKNFIAFK
jgi:hypothetical protein